MLRNRSRAVTTKQALMAEQSSLTSPSQSNPRFISSIFGSPRLINDFLPKAPPEIETISPTSTLDCKQFSPLGAQPLGNTSNQTGTPKIFSRNKHSWENLEPKGIGLALIGSLHDQNSTHNSPQPDRRMVLFGSKLKIQIPQLPYSTSSPTDSPNSPADFGIKTQNSQFSTSLSPFGSANFGPRSLAGFVSATEMELSEDYTCVISHGPNPRTTHIYDDCIVETCCGVVGLSELKRVYSPPSQTFLKSCFACKKNLEQGQDVFMYRGEKAFCSRECRCQEMLFDGVENPELGGAL